MKNSALFRAARRVEIVREGAPVRRNPKVRRADVAAAARLGKRFSGHAPTQARMVAVPKAPSVRVAVGVVTAIMYLARDHGKVIHYIHRFAARSRPSLAVSPDGKRIELLGGAFRFTARGITDRRK